jgi:hypothetical protein
MCPFASLNTELILFSYFRRTIANTFSHRFAIRDPTCLDFIGIKPLIDVAFLLRVAPTRKYEMILFVD